MHEAFAKNPYGYNPLETDAARVLQKGGRFTIVGQERNVGTSKVNRWQADCLRENLMKVTIDITRERYDDLVDMDESIVGFEIPEHLPTTFRLWWKELLLRTKGRSDVEDLSIALGVDASQTDLLVAVAHLEIEQPTAGELVIALYDERRPGQFVLGEDGRPVLLERSWEGDRSGYEYNLGGRFELPDGDCNLTLYSAGSVTLSFDTERATFK